MTFIETLTDKVENELMACIGCNDCMLACPLPETKSVTIAALNYGILQPKLSDPNVIDFVTACTQCQQCVAVCPADLSRADMVLFNKLKIDKFNPDQFLNVQIGSKVATSNWTIAALARHLKQFPLMKAVHVSDLERLLPNVTLRQLSAGEVLCRAGEYHEKLFIVVDGSVQQAIAGPDSEPIKVLVLGPGSFHGEMAVMSDETEQFTVSALEPAIVLEISKFVVGRFMEQCSQFRDTMDSLVYRRSAWVHARENPLFRMLPEESVKRILDQAQLEKFEPGDILIKEGATPEDMYLVRNGFLKVNRQLGHYGQRTLLYFREGDMFGALPLLLGEDKNKYTVEASTYAQVIRIPGQALLKVLEKHKNVSKLLVAQLSETEKVARSKELEPIEKKQNISNTTNMTLSWSNLLDQGVMQSHEVLVIDQSICTDCNNCVDACGVRHGHSRLDRSGLQIDNLLFPSACRHCEDPVCLLCSVNGIVRQPDGEITIVTDNCIGCGACADRCPYNNINMHSLEVQQPTFVQKAVTYITGSSAIDISSKLLNVDTPKIAVKCDLCFGYDDYACVTACPVGAAFRIDPVEAFGKPDFHVGMEMKAKKKDS